MKSLIEFWQRPLGLILVGLTLLSTSCASPDQYRKAIDERDTEIARLRQESSLLKGEKNRLAMELSATGARLREASMRLNTKPAPAPQQTVAAKAPGLTNLGMGYGQRDGVTVITIPSNLSFGAGKSTLSKSGHQALKAVANMLLNSHPGATYSIEGHTDSDPISKSKFENNRALSLARATAVLKYLVVDCDVLDDNCVVVGHGQYKPLSMGSDKASKARNRRVEIVVYESK